MSLSTQEQIERMRETYEQNFRPDELIDLIISLRERAEKAEAERDKLLAEAYYQGLKAGLFIAPPEKPKGDGLTASAIRQFEHSIDRHCRGLSIQYVEQLRKDLNQ